MGSVLVNADRQIVSLGFNGFPRGVADDERLHDRETKYKLVVHAEANAIVNASGPVRGTTAYVWPFMPCSTCCGLLLQSGVERVVSVVNENPRWVASFVVTEKMLEEAGVPLMLYGPEFLD